MQQRLRELLGDDTGTIRPELKALYDNLANVERPATVRHWLGKNTTTAILRRPEDHTAVIVGGTQRDAGQNAESLPKINEFNHEA